MKTSSHRLGAFGLSTYLGKKLYDLSPALYRRLLGSGRSGFVRTAYGVEMASNWEDATFRMCVFGGHGRALADLLKGLNRPFTFLDVGANQGLFTLLAVQNPFCEEAIAFEPVPETFGLLAHNAAHSPMSNRIRCVQAAISSETGTATISLSDGHSGAASLTDRKLGNGRTLTIDTLSAHDIDRLLSGQSDLVIKVDVEGFEWVVIPEVLKLASAPRISHLFFEVDLAWVDVKALSVALRAAGLTKFSRHGGKNHFDMLATRPQGKI